MPEERTTFLAPVMLVLAISLLIASGAVLLLCKLLLRHALTWMEIALIATGLVLATVHVYVSVLWLLTKTGSDHIEAAPQELIAGSWPVAAWLPALSLLLREHSIWIVALAPWMTAQLAMMLARIHHGAPGREVEDGGMIAVAHGPTELTFFQFGATPAALHRALPAVATSLAWQCGIAALAGGATQMAALFFGSGIVFPCWYPARSTSRRSDGLHGAKIAGVLLLSILAAALTLMPLARPRVAAQRAAALLGLADSEATISQPLKLIQPRGNYYSGAILTMPPQPIHHLVMPALSLFQHPNVPAVPVVIPFDGAYWYFQIPDKRPGPDAYIMRGDPIRIGVRSTNEYPMIMEAHQSLAQPIRLDCCRAIRLDLRSMEYGTGGVYIGIALRNTATQATYMLDNQVLPSSFYLRLQQKPAFARAPTEESLSFPLPHVARGAQFNEIVVFIRMVRSSLLNGAHVAVKQFALQR